MGRRWLLVAAATLVVGGTLAPLRAHASAADDYTSSVRRTLTLVRFAEQGDQPSIHQALTELGHGTGAGQPEILSDLRRTPPDLQDADLRLAALLQALSARADSPDPHHAQQELNRLLSMPRYSGLHAGPSLWDQIVQWLLGALLLFLSRVGAGRLQLPFLLPLILLVAGLLFLALLVWALRAGFGWGSPARLPGTRPILAPSADHFGEADRRAVAGDYLGAIRALAAGVAAAISGERAWDQSPLTVRELFQRADQALVLQAILVPFEAAVYGHRPPTQVAYARAAEVAAPFRDRRA